MPCSLLKTERLLLRHHEAADVPQIVSLLNDFEVSKNLANVPHPYTEDDARSFLARTIEDRAKGDAYPFVVTLKTAGTLVGGCGLRLQDDGSFDLGYWFGKPYWGRGYASEAAGRVVRFAFKELRAPILKAGWYHDNPASGRVLEKLGAMPAGVEHHNCLARGHAVYTHKVVLDRENFGSRR